MKTQSKRTVICLADAIEVVAGAAHELIGGEVAKTIGGEKATRQALADAAAARVQARFAKYTSKKAAK